MRCIRLYKTAEHIDESNLADTEQPLTVNCVGIDNREDNFKTYKPNGRRDYALYYVQEGEIKVFTCDGEEKILRKGMGIIFFAGQQYHYVQNSPQVSFFWLHFTGSLAEDTLRRFGFTHEYIYDIGYNETVINRFQQIIDEFIMREYDFGFSASLCLMQILVEIERCLLTENNSDKLKLKKSVKYIHESFQKDFSIETLAKMENLSVSHYRKLFIRQMGISPKQYLTATRISFACDLLMFSNSPIEEIALKSGFHDLTYFYRVFKKVKNLTPHQFRALNLANDSTRDLRF